MHSMKWVRRLVVGILSIVLLISLLGAALSMSVNSSLAHPNRVENWLNQSNLYANLATTITNQAQSAIQNNVNGGAAISKAVVQQAAESAFPQSQLKQDVITFINSNYQWLEGKTSIPDFRIDLSGAKQNFAIKVADVSVLTHLKSLSTCTAAQTLQLENANPLLLSCIPSGVSPQFEATQIAEQLVNTSTFLNNPVITASSVSTKGLDKGQPYYKKLSNLPKAYRLSQKLPWLLGILSLLSALGIIFCARAKRSGLRIVSLLIFISGVLLIASKFAADTASNKLAQRVFKNINDHNIQQSLKTFVHLAEKQFSMVDLQFGIAYLVIAIVIILILISTRNRKSRLSREEKAAPKSSVQTRSNRGKSPPNFDMLSPPRAVDRLAARPRTNPQQVKKRTAPKPPRLIQ